jgi:predicted acetyltransferase
MKRRIFRLFINYTLHPVQYLWLDDLFIVEKHRGQGLGLAIMAQLVQVTKIYSYVNIYVKIPKIKIKYSFGYDSRLLRWPNPVV